MVTVVKVVTLVTVVRVVIVKTVMTVVTVVTVVTIVTCPGSRQCDCPEACPTVAVCCQVGPCTRTLTKLDLF